MGVTSLPQLPTPNSQVIPNLPRPATLLIWMAPISVDSSRLLLPRYDTRNIFSSMGFPSGLARSNHVCRRQQLSHSSNVGAAACITLPRPSSFIDRYAAFGPLSLPRPRPSLPVHFKHPGQCRVRPKTLCTMYGDANSTYILTLMYFHPSLDPKQRGLFLDRVDAHGRWFGICGDHGGNAASWDPLT